MARKPRTPKRTKSGLIRKPAIAVLVAVLLVAGAGWALLNHHKNKTPAISTSGSSKTPTKPYVNLSPPTSQDIQNNQADKQALANSGSSSAPIDSNGKKAVTVILTSASNNDINGYITGVFEDGGTCNAKLTNSATGQVVSVSSAGFENASYTSCTPMHPNLSGGNWSVVLSYNSPTAEGSSASEKVQ